MEMLKMLILLFKYILEVTNHHLSLGYVFKNATHPI